MEDGEKELANKEPARREELEAAHDYRRQLQERSAEGYEIAGKEARLRWVDDHRELLADIATTSWGPEPTGLGFAEFKKLLEDTPLSTPHDDPLTQSVVRMLCEEVENACRALGIPLRSGIAFGSTSALHINAERYSVPLTEASVLSLSSGFITFCSHVSKAFSMSVLHEADDHEIRVSCNPKLVIAKIGASEDLKGYWTRLFGAYAFGSGPLDFEHRLVSFPASVTRIQLLQSMERFSVAHEYAHHIADHGRRDVLGAGKDPEAVGEEFEADLFALSLDRYIGTNSNPFSASGAAAVLLLKCLECVKRVRRIFLTGDDTTPPRINHPETVDRIAAFDGSDELAPDHAKRSFKAMREDFAVIIDEIYKRLRPIYIEMHKQGLRPLDSTEWLP
jgi:hypothetical protein